MLKFERRLAACAVIALALAIVGVAMVAAETQEMDPRPSACSISIKVYADHDYIDLTPIDRTGHQHRVGLDAYDRATGVEQDVKYIGDGVFRHYLQDGDAGKQFMAQSKHYNDTWQTPYCWEDAVYFAPGK